jgi:predicted nucleotidyltransferase
MIDIDPRHLSILLAMLEQYVPDSEVWAYGSRVEGHSHSGSDLDLVIRNPDDLTKSQADLWKLKEALSESNLPILVDVMDWARVPAHFKQEMQQAHVVLRNGRVPYAH